MRHCLGQADFPCQVSLGYSGFPTSAHSAAEIRPAGHCLRSFSNTPFVMPLCANTAFTDLSVQWWPWLLCITMRCSKPLARSPGEGSCQRFPRALCPPSPTASGHHWESLDFIQVELHRHALLCLISFAQHNVLKIHTFYLFLLQSNILWYGYTTILFFIV